MAAGILRDETAPPTLNNMNDPSGFASAGSVADLQDIVRTLREKGANLLATEQKVDTSRGGY